MCLCYVSVCYLQDAAPVRVALQVLAGLEHAERDAVEQNHQHADSLKPRRAPVKVNTAHKEIKSSNIPLYSAVICFQCQESQEILFVCFCKLWKNWLH